MAALDFENILNPIDDLKKNLLRLVDEKKHQEWENQGREMINDSLRKSKNITEMLQYILDKLLTHLEACAGTIYIVEGDFLVLAASSALDKRKLSKKRPLDEGLTGNALRQKKMILLTDVPDDLFIIKSGMGEASPLNVAAFPLIHEDGVNAVLEIGSFRPFSEVRLKFVEEMAKIIAGALDSTRKNEEIRKLSLESENRLRAINESAALLELDPGGKILSANQHLLELTGYAKGELDGKHHRVLVSKSYAKSKEYAQFWERLREGKHLSGEFERYTRNGDKKWLWCSYYPISDVNGEIMSILKIVYDRTEQKEFEQNLQKKEAELNKFFSLSLDLMVIAGTDGYFKKLSGSWEKVLGYSQKELLSKPFIEFVHPDDVQKTTRELKRLAEGKETINFQNRYRKKNGEYIWLSWKTSPDPEAGLLYASARDITAELEQSLELKQQIKSVDNSALVIITDLDGNITYANDLFCEISQYSCEELRGKNPRILKSGKQPPELFEGLWKTISSGKVWQGEICDKAKDGSFFWAHMTITPFLELDGDIEKYVAVMFDKTDEKEQKLLLDEQYEELKSKQAELEEMNTELETQTEELRATSDQLQIRHEEISQMNAELEEKNLMLDEKNRKLEIAREDLEKQARELEMASKYKSEFLANMSHELRTPLNSILILSQMLEDNGERNLTEEQVKSARVIHKSGEGLLQLINDILDLSKVESGKMSMEFEQLKVADIVGNMANTFKPVSKEKNLDFTSEIDKGVPGVIHTDQLRIEQILKNLLSNAFKFTDKGKVELRVFNPPTENFPGVDHNNNYVAFSVSDTGIGIPEDKQAQVFETFQQVDGSTQRRYGGTGLGLSICMEIARLFGGEIKLESVEGEGSTFTVLLPVNCEKAYRKNVRESDNEKENVSQPASKTDATTLKKEGENNGMNFPDGIDDDRKNINEKDKVILIVEDDVHFANLLVKFARERGHKGIVAVRGDRAIAYTRKYQPYAIMLDIKLPGKHGFTVMEELKSNPDTRTIPVYMFSSLDYARMKSLESGAIDFASKPVNSDQLDDAFQRIEAFRDKEIKSVLIVDENVKHQLSLKKYLGNGKWDFFQARNVEETFNELGKREIDCMILGMEPLGADGFKVLEKVREDEKHRTLPIIAYIGKNFSRAEEKKIREYASSIIVKTAPSYKQLREEFLMFLHAVDKQEADKKIEPYHTEEALKGGRALLVEDDSRNMYSLKNLLEECGMEVFPAENGSEALEILNKKTDLDIVLTDIMMSELDGYKLIKTIRKKEKYKSLPVVAVTAKAMSKERDKCIEAGASDYISKPIDNDQLLSLLRIWLYNENTN